MAVITVRQWFRVMRAADLARSMADARRTRMIWFRGTVDHQVAGLPFIGPICFDEFLDLWQFVQLVVDIDRPMPWADLVEAAAFAIAARQYRRPSDAVVH